MVVNWRKREVSFATVGWLRYQGTNRKTGWCSPEHTIFGTKMANLGDRTVDNI